MSMPIDWAYTPLCMAVSKDKIEFNSNMDDHVFVEKEVDYVIEMMKNNFDQYKLTETIIPFYTKAMATLKALMLE